MLKEKFGIEHFEGEEPEKPKTMEEMYSKKSINTIKNSKALIKWFILIIIFYLIASYVGAKYLPALCLNYFYYFIPFGKFFSLKPQKATILHGNQTKYSENSKFFKFDQDLEKFYYELPKYNATMMSIGKGLVTQPYGTIKNSHPPMERIYVLEYCSLNLIQKLVMIIIAGIQMFLAIIFTFLNAFGNIFYLFFPKPHTSLFFNAAYVYEKIDPEYRETLFKSQNTEIPLNKSNKIILGGWTNFKNFINYLALFFTDQLTYGATYLSSDDIEIFEFTKVVNEGKIQDPKMQEIFNKDIKKLEENLQKKYDKKGGLFSKKKSNNEISNKINEKKEEFEEEFKKKIGEYVLQPRFSFAVWWNRLKYFFTLFFPFLILFNWIRGDLSSVKLGSTSMIFISIILIIYFAKRILNIDKNPYPYFSYNDIKEKMESETLNEAWDKIKKVSDDVYKMNVRFTNDSIKSAYNSGMELTAHEKSEVTKKIKRKQKGGLYEDLEKSKTLKNKIKEFREEVESYLKD